MRRTSVIVACRFAIDPSWDALNLAVIDFTDTKSVCEFHTAELRRRCCLVHRRYLRLDVGEEGSRIGFTDHEEMRFCRALEKRGKDRSGNWIDSVHGSLAVLH